MQRDLRIRRRPVVSGGSGGGFTVGDWHYVGDPGEPALENSFISIADIADVAGFSESHFMRYFKETMGTAFVDYLKDYRLTMAARLLQSSDSSVLSISGEVGFESLSYFNRAFKKHYGMTPLQYRKGS